MCQKLRGVIDILVSDVCFSVFGSFSDSGENLTTSKITSVDSAVSSTPTESDNRKYWKISAAFYMMPR